MFKILKNILGIEGVRIKLEIPESFSKNGDHLKGRLILSSKSSKKVKSITIKLIEKYKRGRKDSELINEYLLSKQDIDLNIILDESQPAKYDFELPLNLLKSDMDKLEEKNILAKGLVKVAKKLKNVESYYRIQATAKVEGTAIDPLAKASILLE